MARNEIEAAVRDESDTIAAIATAVGGGIGVIRISGPAALSIARARFRGLPREPRPRLLYHGWWHDGAGNDLDEGLLAFFGAPRSYTGEDVVELQLHGGALVLTRAAEICWAAGARPAGPGEFTRRAFLNDKLDLTRAEAIADMIGARTDRALAQARSHLEGELHGVVTSLREEALDLRARIEVNIDFIEEDVPPLDPADLARRAGRLAAALGELAGTWRRGRLLREGARVVLVGPPNAGKSSLFNTICEADRAIVTEVAGTTRDTLEECVDMLGVPVVLVDTAGLRATDDPVEAAGVSRTRSQIARADLIVELIEPGLASEVPPTQLPVVSILSKADLPGRSPAGAASPALALSARTGEGIAELKRAVVQALGGLGEEATGVTIGRERHRDALERASRALEQASEALLAAAEPELVALDVQDAVAALDELLGETTIEDVLDRLFSTFCIGK